MKKSTGHWLGPRLLRLGVSLTALIGTTGCLDPQATIFELTACNQGAEGCAMIADGVSPSYVTLKVPLDKHKRRRQKVEVDLVLGRGDWSPAEASTPRQRKADLGPTGEVTLRFIPTTEPGPLVVQATLDGFSLSQVIVLQSAPVLSVDLSVDGAGLPNAAGERKLTARVDVAGAGKPSNGSTVCFEIQQKEPSDAFAQLSAARVVVTDETAETSLRVGTELRSVTVIARAASDDACKTSEVSSMVTLSRTTSDPAPTALRLSATPPVFATGTTGSGKISAEVATVPSGQNLDGTYYVDFEISDRSPPGAIVELSSARAFFGDTSAAVQVDFQTGPAVRRFVVRGVLGRRSGDAIGLPLIGTTTVTDDQRRIGVADLDLSSNPAVLSAGRFDYPLTVRPRPFPNGLLGEGVWVELSVSSRSPMGALASLSPDRLFFSDGAQGATSTLVVSDAVTAVQIEGRVFSLSSTVPLGQQPLLTRSLELVRPQ